MRHPLRQMTLQGVWYAVGSSLVKLSGLVLLPIMTNTRYLSVADYGLWGVLEISVLLATATIGLSLPLGLVRFHHDEGEPATLAAAWWASVALAGAAALLGVAAAELLASEAMRPVYRWLSLHVACEILFAVVLASFRAREQAWKHTGFQALKLALLVAFALTLMVTRHAGMEGLARAYAWSSALALAGALVATGRREIVVPRFSRPLLRKLLAFSTPLVVGGIGSMILNAGGRYVLGALGTEEDLAWYTLAGRFGSVVSMFAVQPLNLAWMPILFRLEERQRPEVLRLLVPYLAIALGLTVIGVSTFAAPLLDLMGSDPTYLRGLPLVPWIGLGFALFGLAVVTTGILALFQRTRAISATILGAAGLNLALNFALVPVLGATGSAVASFVAYLALVIVHFRLVGPLVAVRYPWARMAGVGLTATAAALAGAHLPYEATAANWLARIGVPAGWVLVLLVTRMFTLQELRQIAATLRGGAR